jgi:3-dehydroquinate dehydratase
LDENYDVLFSLLGSNYLLPLDLNLIPEATNAYILCAENQEIPQKNHIHKVVSSIEQARKLKTILINVKGYQFLSFAKKVKEDYDLKRVDLVLEELTNL